MKIIMILLSFGIFANDLTLKNAVSLAIKNNPELKVIKKNAEIKKNSGIANSQYPNPEIEVETSDFLGTGGYSGFKNSEVSLSISQEIVLNGKNSKLIDLADSETKTIALELKKQKINLEYKIENIFLELLTLKKLQTLLIKNKEISENIFKTVENIKNSGEISQLEVIKAKIDERNSIIALKTNKNKINSLKKLLFIVIGDKDLKFDNIAGELETNLEINNKNKVENIDIKIKESVYQSGLQFLKLEEANSIPNLTFKLGANRYQEFGDYSFTFAISMPIPLFNSNKAKIRESRFKIDRNKLEITSVKLKLKEELGRFTNELKILKEELSNLKNDVLPMAKESLELAREGYREGEFKYLDLLDAKKTFISIEELYIKKLSRFNLLKLRIDYLLK